jgi:DNA-binding transcriptional ArsR family regulator
MKNKSAYELHAEIIKALAHPLRIEVIEILQQGELCFTDVLKKTGGLKSNLSQHMSIMVNNRLLRVRRDSRCNYYSLSSVKVAKACALMREILTDNIKRQNKLLEKA